MPVLHTIRRVHRLNAYDSCRIGTEGGWPISLSSGYVRLFGNANIGRTEFTNLHVPGYLSSDETATVEHWYARTDLVPDLLPATPRADFQRFAATTVVSFFVGDKPRWRRSLAELLADRPWEPPSVTGTADSPAALAALDERVKIRIAEGTCPVIVPVRQHVSVELVAFQGQVIRLEQSLGGPATFWVHLEGIITRDHG